MNGLINDLRQLMNGNPQALYDAMLKNNKQFAEFVKSNEGKTPEQIAQAYGIDPNILRSLIK